MSDVMSIEKKKSTRGRSTMHRKWRRSEEFALINFIKKNRDFEKPCARVYYTKFLFESGLDVDWKLVRCKVRNMRTAYRRAKENETNKVDSTDFTAVDLRNKILKLCWYVDDFDMLFPDLMNNGIDKHYDPFFDDEFSKDAPLCNDDKTSQNLKMIFLPEEESTVSSLSKSIDGDLIAAQKNILYIKKEKQDEDTSIKQPEPEKVKEKLNCPKEKGHQETGLKERQIRTELQQTPFRNRPNPIRKWQRHEEIAIIAFLKQNSDFEHPNARLYYTKFLLENGIDAEWHNVRSKVRNMRVSYRKAKEHELKEGDGNNCNIRALRNQILRICWFVDDFDIIFPNDMDNSACLHIYKNPDLILDDDFSKAESFTNVNNSSKNFNNNFLLEEDSTSSSLSNSIEGNILANQKNFINLKNQKRDEDTSLKHQELELAKEKFNFEKEKFRQEIRLKEKEIENEEKLKVMELQMKERIAIKKLEIEEMLALRSVKKPENSFSDIYNNLT